MIRNSKCARAHRRRKQKERVRTLFNLVRVTGRAVMELHERLDRLYAQQAQRDGTPQDSPQDYPQSKEANEYRYIDAWWLDALAYGLTKGAELHPGESWKDIDSYEHAVRALRHLNLYRAEDRNDDHLLNASMRCMMAWVMANIERSRSEEEA